MQVTLFRVECNNGSKYFDNSFEAIAFYNLKREQPMASVQLLKFITSTTQELVSPAQNQNERRNKMAKMFTKGFKPKSTTKEAKNIIRDEIKDHYAPDNGRDWLNAVKRDAEAAYDPCTPNTNYHKGANLVQNGSFACYYSDQKIMLGKIYGKDNVAKWDGQKTHETYKHLIGREYAQMIDKDKRG